MITLPIMLQILGATLLNRAQGLKSAIEMTGLSTLLRRLNDLSMSQIPLSTRRLYDANPISCKS